MSWKTSQKVTIKNSRNQKLIQNSFSNWTLWMIFVTIFLTFLSVLNCAPDQGGHGALRARLRRGCQRIQGQRIELHARRASRLGRDLPVQPRHRPPGRDHGHAPEAVRGPGLEAAVCCVGPPGVQFNTLKKCHEKQHERNLSISYNKKFKKSVVDTYLLFKLQIWLQFFLRNRAPGSSLKSTQPANLLDPIDLPSIWMAEWGHSWARDHAVSMFQTHAHPGCPSSISDLMEKVGA